MKTCEECDGKCCKYISVEIDPPKEKIDFEELKWYLCHEKVLVYIDEEGDWIVEFQTPCKFQDENGRCKIYENRTQICRDYGLEECDENGEGEAEHIKFKTPEDIDAYYEEQKKLGKVK